MTSKTTSGRATTERAEQRHQTCGSSNQSLPWDLVRSQAFPLLRRYGVPTAVIMGTFLLAGPALAARTDERRPRSVLGAAITAAAVVGGALLLVGVIAAGARRRPRPCRHCNGSGAGGSCGSVGGTDGSSAAVWGSASNAQSGSPDQRPSDPHGPCPHCGGTGVTSDGGFWDGSDSSTDSSVGGDDGGGGGGGDGGGGDGGGGD